MFFHRPRNPRASIASPLTHNAVFGSLQNNNFGHFPSNSSLQITWASILDKVNSNSQEPTIRRGGGEFSGRWYALWNNDRIYRGTKNGEVSEQGANGPCKCSGIYGVYSTWEDPDGHFCASSTPRIRLFREEVDTNPSVSRFMRYHDALFDNSLGRALSGRSSDRFDRLNRT